MNTALLGAPFEHRWVKTMTQRQGTSWFRITGLVTFGLAAALLLGTAPASASGGHHHHHHHDGDDDDGAPDFGYKGSAALSLISVSENVERCGSAPVVELTFEGAGIDTAGGNTTIESSACQNTATGEVFDLVAVDTYASGSVNIASETFFLVFNPETCASSSLESVRFDVDGGTGAFAGASGGGKFDIALNDPSCNGEVTPAYVWFRGHID